MSDLFDGGRRLGRLARNAPALGPRDSGVLGRVAGDDALGPGAARLSGGPGPPLRREDRSDKLVGEMAHRQGGECLLLQDKLHLSLWSESGFRRLLGLTTHPRPSTGGGSLGTRVPYHISPSPRGLPAGGTFSGPSLTPRPPPSADGVPRRKQRSYWRRNPPRRPTRPSTRDTDDHSFGLGRGKSSLRTGRHQWSNPLPQSVTYLLNHSLPRSDGDPKVCEPLPRDPPVEPLPDLHG